MWVVISVVIVGVVLYYIIGALSRGWQWNRDSLVSRQLSFDRRPSSADSLGDSSAIWRACCLVLTGSSSSRSTGTRSSPEETCRLSGMESTWTCVTCCTSTWSSPTSCWWWDAATLNSARTCMMLVFITSATLTSLRYTSNCTYFLGIVLCTCMGYNQGYGMYIYVCVFSYKCQ